MKENIYPEILRIRDTGLYDDAGGAGQRIYTTAGQGYDKVRYIREDVIVERLQRTTEILNELNDMLAGHLTAVTDYLIKTGWRK